jgi:AmiR/NasT family two-component response regulator
MPQEAPTGRPTFDKRSLAGAVFSLKHCCGVLVLTTMEAEESELLREARGLGVTAVVKKPWHPQQLRDLVEAIVHGGG